MRELSIAECWEFLAQHEFGRLAFVLDGGADIAPVNYAVDDDQIIFRTALGSKFAGAMSDATAAFEVDEINGEEATSVVLRGLAVELPSLEEARVEQLGLRPWIDWGRDGQPHLVAIRADHISGRRYPLHQPWRSMMRS